VKIIDTQLHDPTPWLDWTARDREVQRDLMMELTLANLDALGIDGVLMVPGWHWKLDAEVVQRCPTRLAYVPNIKPDVPDIDQEIKETKGEFANGLVALRAVIGWPMDGSEVARFDQGVWNPVFEACENYQVPVFLFIAGYLPKAEKILASYPGLTVIIDHLGLRQPPMDDPETPPFKSLPELLDLARFPNAAVKLCGLPALSTESYPFDDVVPQLRAIVDAFGADRLMWASDITRFTGRMGGLRRSENPRAVAGYVGKHTYAESLGFIQHSPHLRTEEKEWILGGTVQRLLGWPARGD
jgi:predicted TIM-barrel fold metal-dependent hydrolase